MNFRQKLLKMLYPLVMKLSGNSKKGRIIRNRQKAQPTQSFHQLKALLNNGEELNFSQLKGKKVLLVNTASNCGYTGQYSELQKLQEQHGEQLQVVGFPANDFKEQEKGNDAAIAQFCQLNFGVTFPLAKKSQVVKGSGQHPVFEWLSHPEKNGWNLQEPDWNFSKYLINEEGILTHYFGPAVSPLSKEVQAHIS